MIDRDVVLERVRALLDSLQSREGVQGAAMLQRVAEGLSASHDDAEVALHCAGLARALRGIESQGKLTPEEFAITLELHEEIDLASVRKAD
jgi:hypothetical protein